MKIQKVLLISIFLIITACSEEEKSKELAKSSSQESHMNFIQPKPLANPDRNAYFGDLHVHTANSFDAYTFGTISQPSDAYRFARGEAIPHPTGYQIQMSRPLDFYAVTDHAMFLGLLKEAADTSSEFSRYEFSKPMHNLNDSVSGSFLSVIKRAGLFRPFARTVNQGLENGTVDRELTERIGNSVWKRTIKAADDAYRPGIFTTFAGYEYTSSIDLYEKYLHRNVIFRGTKNLPVKLFSRLDSQDPEKLWDWMDQLRGDGVESLAIPHNSNISGGAAFSMNDYNGGPIDEAYVKKRLLNEPLTEITQAKGTSETHPLLSKNDEWAAFEAVTSHPGENLISNLKGSYVRNAYLRGLTFKDKGLSNPFKFGVIGSSDTHVGGGSYTEENHFSKIGVLDGTPELRGSVPFDGFTGFITKLVQPEALQEVDGKDYMAVSSRLIRFASSGLAGVWAEENTRESIYNALRRKETFGTSGPRIKVRFFANYEYQQMDLNNPALISNSYKYGIPMGGTLIHKEGSIPSFLVWAISDVESAPLERIQIIKGWIQDGEQKEKVFDVACSDNMPLDPATHRCPDNGAKVDLSTCSFSEDLGDRELKAIWMDPSFTPKEEAFYYLRVLENPTCRWSTWDAMRVGERPRSDIPELIQERAWSSPIWYSRAN